MTNKFYVVSYDITDDKKRNNVCKTLKNYGVRVQKSVFECILTDSQYCKMKGNLDKVIDYDTDSIRYYRLCKNCVEIIEITGNGHVHDEQDLMIL